MDILPHILYINLDIRKDRRDKIENELKNMNLIADRIPAFNTLPTGYLGATLSHIEALKVAREKKWPYVLILEDDFQFIVDKKIFNDSIYSFFSMNMEFDVLFLSYNIKESESINDLIGRTTSAQTASGYIVHSRFYETLLDNFQDAYNNLLITNDYSKYALDQYWKKLQSTHLFYFFKTRLGIQRADYSNIERRFVNYKV